MNLGRTEKNYQNYLALVGDALTAEKVKLDFTRTLEWIYQTQANTEDVEAEMLDAFTEYVEGNEYSEDIAALEPFFRRFLYSYWLCSYELVGLEDRPSADEVFSWVSLCPDNYSELTETEKEILSQYKSAMAKAMFDYYTLGWEVVEVVKYNGLAAKELHHFYLRYTEVGNHWLTQRKEMLEGLGKPYSMVELTEPSVEQLTGHMYGEMKKALEAAPAPVPELQTPEWTPPVNTEPGKVDVSALSETEAVVFILPAAGQAADVEAYLRARLGGSLAVVGETLVPGVVRPKPVCLYQEENPYVSAVFLQLAEDVSLSSMVQQFFESLGKFTTDTWSTDAFALRRGHITHVAGTVVSQDDRAAYLLSGVDAKDLAKLDTMSTNLLNRRVQLLRQQH